jgi:hypothetical protein
MVTPAEVGDCGCGLDGPASVSFCIAMVDTCAKVAVDKQRERCSLGSPASGPARSSAPDLHKSDPSDRLPPCGPVVLARHVGCLAENGCQWVPSIMYVGCIERRTESAENKLKPLDYDDS